MDTRSAAEPTATQGPHDGRADVGAASSSSPDDRRPAAQPCSRRGPTPTCSGSGGPEVVGRDAAVVRDRCTRRRRLPAHVRQWGRGTDGVLRPLPRGEPPSRLVWTNEEGDGGHARDDRDLRGGSRPRTRLVVHDLYPSKEALDDAVASGATSWVPETFDQLDELLVRLGTSTRR